MRNLHPAGAFGLALVGPLALAAALTSSPRPDLTAEAAPMLFYWRASLLPEQADTASNLLSRMVAYMRGNYPATRLRVLTNDLDRNDTVHWLMEHEDLATRKQWEREMDEDEGWQGIVGGVDAAFDVEGDLTVYLFHVAGPVVDDPSKTVRRITVTRSLEFQVPAARQFAARVVAYLESTYPRIDARVYSSDVHDPHALYWMVDHENPATWESIRRELNADEAYVELLADAEGLFLEEARSDLLLNY